MPDRRSYDPVLSSQAVAFLVGLSKSRQRKLIDLIFQLSESPSQVGDYSEPDDSGRAVQFLLIRSTVIAFWADHAAKELRIVEIEEV
jgi:hypothetical protein